MNQNKCKHIKLGQFWNIGVQSGNRTTKNEIHKLEQMQRRVTRFVRAEMLSYSLNVEVE